MGSYNGRLPEPRRGLILRTTAKPLPGIVSPVRLALYCANPSSNTTGKVDVQPSLFQGSLSYTVILYTYSTDANYRITVQFRYDKQDLFGVSKASRTYRPIVRLVTYQGIYEGLFVCISPFVEGTPYISILISSKDFQVPLKRKIATAIDLTDLVTRGARANTAIFDTPLSDLTSTLERIRHKVNNYIFRYITLRNKIPAYINKLLLNLHNIATLPVILAY